MLANTMNPDQAASKEQSDQGSFCLQYRLPKYKQMREQMTVENDQMFSNSLFQMAVTLTVPMVTSLMIME